MKLRSLIVSTALALACSHLSAGISVNVGSESIAIGTAPYSVTVPVSMAVDSGSQAGKFILVLQYDSTKMTFNSGASAKAGSHATSVAELKESVAGKIIYTYVAFSNVITISATETIANLVFDIVSTEPGTIAVYLDGNPSVNGVILDNDDENDENDYQNGQVKIVKPFNAADATIPTGMEDTPAQKDLTGLFTDKDDLPIAGRVIGVTDPDNGTVTLNEGIVTYTPDPDFNGTDTFVYTAENAAGTYTDTGTVTVTVAAVNDPPVNAVAPSVEGTFQYDEQLTAAPGTWNDDKDYPAGGAPTITYAYQWWTSTEADGRRSAAAIEGATSATLTVPSGVAGKYLAVMVTATDGGDPDTATAVAWSAWTQVAKAPATVTVTDPAPSYDGAAQEATVTTVPADKTVVVTYDDSTTAPTDAGTYTVVATIDDPDYAGTGNGTLTIKKAGLTIAAGNATRNYFAPNSTIEYSPTFTLTAVPSRTALLGDDTTEEFEDILEFGTDASDDPDNRSPWDVAYTTTVVISEQNLGELPAKNYEIAFADGVLTIDKGSAPYAIEGANSADNRHIVVSGDNPTSFNLNRFFKDDDEGDSLVFSEINDITGPAGIGIAPGAASGDVVFTPGEATQGSPGADSISFTVKVFDSALDSDGSGLPLAGTEDGKTTIYLSLLDNQAPDLAWTGTSASPVNEGDTIQIAVQATETPQRKPGPDDIASITLKVKKNGVDVDVTPTVVLDGKTGTLACSILTDKDTSTFMVDTVYDIEIVATDAAGAVATETRAITVTNVNVPPTIDDIADVTVQEDSEALEPILLTGVSNGGEADDPAIEAPGTLRYSPAEITASTEQTNIVSSITVAAEGGSEVRGNGDPQTFRLTYTLVEDAHGDATITVTVNDGSGTVTDRGTEATIQKSFTITVQPVNDPPVNTTAPSITGVGHVGRMLTAGTGVWNDDKDLSWGDVRGRVGWITFAYQWQVRAAVGDRAAAWEDIDGATAPTFVPAVAQNGMDVRVVVTATDSGIPAPGESADIASESVRIANEAPAFVGGVSTAIWGFEDNQALTVSVGWPPGFDFALVANDGDNDMLTWSIQTAPAHGEATVNQEGNVAYVPDPDYFNSGDTPGVARAADPDAFVVQVNDGRGGTAQVTVNVTVVAINDAPVIYSLKLDAKDAAGADAFLGLPADIAKIVATAGVADVDDAAFDYDYNWTVLRDGVATLIATGTKAELTTADLGTVGLAAAFIKDDKITVTVCVTDQGGGQLHSLPAVKATVATACADASDVDADGLPDAWEQTLIDANPADGIATLTDLRPEDDFDGDGASNELEWSTNHDAASDADAPDPAAMLAYGDQALRDRNLRLAHAAYMFAASDAPSTDAKFSAAATTLFDLFERPTPDLGALLDAWEVVYEKDVFASENDPEMLASEPFDDANGNGERDVEGWQDDGWQAPNWWWREEWADNDVWDHEPFDDDNGNGWRDPEEDFTDENWDGNWNHEWFWDDNGNGRYDCETFEDLNANGEWDEHAIFPDGAPSPNETLDTLRAEADTRIDLVLGLLGSVLAEAPVGWTRAVAPDMLPDQWSDLDRQRLATIDKADVRAAAAILHAAKGLLAMASGYDLDVPYDDINWTERGTLKTLWAGHANLLVPRAERTAAFGEAKEHFRAALGFAGDALDALVDGQTRGGWLERQQYPDDNIAEYRAATEDVLASLDGPHRVAAADFADLHSDLVVDLSRLFAEPIGRRDILPYDFEVSTIDWIAADPTLKGLFPQETPATWYGRAAFLHNRDNDELEQDWPELADDLDRNAADAALDLAKAAVRFLGAYDLTADYDAVSADIDVDLVLGALWDDGGDFLQVRDATRLAEARPLFKGGLDKAIAAIDQYLAGPAAETDPGYLFAEEGDYNQDRLAQRRANLDDARRSLDGPHAWDSADYEQLDSPLVVDLRPLFDNPVERTDLLPYDFFGESIDWLALDPTLHGILPQETRPGLYRRYVFWSDDEDLIPVMNAVDDDFAEAVTDAAAAAIQLLAGYDLRTTAGSIALDDLDFTRALWEDNPNVLTLRDVPSRDGSTFEQARTSFASALDKAVAATDRMLAGQGRGGIADRHKWCHLDQEEDDGLGGRRHSPYHADWLEARRYLAAWQAAMGDTGAELPVNGDEPILAHLRQLFDNPLSRASLPTGWKNGDNEFWRQFDWTTIPDASLNGFFPGFTSKAHVYANYTHYFESCRAWIGSAELGCYFREESPEFFEQLARFDIYRRTRNVSGVTEPAQVDSFLPSAVAERQTWYWLVPDPPADGEHSYQVEFVFASDDGGEAGTRTPQWLVRATDSNGNYLPDWWENAYGVSDAWEDDDGDGLSNRDEYEVFTDPTLVDTDGDGMSDALENYHGMNPLQNDAGGDLDADGYTNARELSVGTNPAMQESNPAERALAVSWLASPVDGSEVADARLPGSGILPHPYAPGALSADGTRLFFTSSTPWFGVRSTGIYARDLTTGTTTLVNAADGTADVPSNGSDSFLAANSDGGRYVLFLSTATNLTDDLPQGTFFYLRDTLTQTTHRLPIPGGELVAEPHSAITPDGAVLVVETVDAETGEPCVYRYDHTDGQAMRCWTTPLRGDFTRCTLGPPSATLPQYPDWRLDTALSADGRYVFLSTDAVLRDEGAQCVGIYRFDAQTGATECASIDPADNALATGVAEFVAASGDGRMLLWRARDAIFGDETSAATRLFLRDLRRGRTVLVSAAEGLASRHALLSADGRYVAFTTALADPDESGSELWLFDRVPRTAELLHRESNDEALFAAAAEEGETCGDALASCLSEDGRYVFFRSRSAALAIDGNAAGRSNVFRYDRVRRSVEQVNLDSYGEAADDDWLDGYWQMLGYQGVSSEDRLLGVTRDGRWAVVVSEANLANAREWFWEFMYRVFLWSRPVEDEFGDPYYEEPDARALFMVDLARGEVRALPAGLRDGRTLALATHAPAAVADISVLPVGGGEALPCSAESLLIPSMFSFGAPSISLSVESRLGCVGWLDTDGDGLTDRFEKDFGLDPLAARGRWQDDGDGLSPRDEEFYDTDPTNPDTDGDGLLDGQEVGAGTDPRRADADQDTDGDGWTNAEEVAAGWNPVWPDRSWIRHVGAGWNLNAIPPGLAEAERTSDLFRRDERSAITLFAYDAARLRYRTATDDLSEEVGYWLAAGESYDLDFTPAATRDGARDGDAPTSVNLVRGWNLVSIPGYQEYPDVWTVFLRHPAVAAVWAWDGQSGLYYAIAEGDLDCLDAYWVYALEPVTVPFEGAE